MKLYEINLPARVKCECSDGSREVTVDHLDGFYSYCRTSKGSVVHLCATAELTANTDGSWSLNEDAATVPPGAQSITRPQ